MVDSNFQQLFSIKKVSVIIHHIVKGCFKDVETKYSMYCESNDDNDTNQSVVVKYIASKW